MSNEHDCEGCPLTDRREFLRDAAVGTLGLLSVLGMPRGAFAMLASGAPLAEVKPLAVNGAMRAYALPAADGVGIDRDADVILVRWKGAAFAFDLSCPHQNTALRWDETANHFRCPKHKSEYEPTGTFIRGRATRGMDKYAIQSNGDRVTVDTSKRFEQDKDPAGWNSALARVA